LVRIGANGVHHGRLADTARPGENRAAAAGELSLYRREQVRPTDKAGRRRLDRENVGLQRDPPFSDRVTAFVGGTSRSP